jgi:hypothetical protein
MKGGEYEKNYLVEFTGPGFNDFNFGLQRA